VFFKDAAQLVNVILQIGFWLTPVFWSDSSMNENILRVLRLNPLYYILTGYRDTLISGVGFWSQPFSMTVYFWMVTVIIMLIGLKVYRKLKVHFSDLL
jgi:ABC-type polysaccharide/polyol phosphate export permease